ncbi:MAG: PHP domain-containing protein [Candidatus Micrarchaeota archaeon]|nr:PHP domain-containing protein [Candidatus Micrarchaeota archaeon]
MKRYDLHLHSNLSVGKNSPEEMVRFAEILGFRTIAFCEHYSGITKLKEWFAEIEKIDTSIDVVKGVEIIEKNPVALKKTIFKVRRYAELVCVHGGDYTINREACRNRMVDVLAHPELGRNDPGLDEFCVRSAVENDVLIQVNFRLLMKGYGKTRARVFELVSENIRLCNELGAKVIISSGAYSIWGMRDPGSLNSVLKILGRESQPDINQILERNRKKLSGRLITDGIEVVS